MNGRVAGFALAVALACFPAVLAQAQALVQPTTRPTLTADNEPWYLDGEPISYAGNLYYPTGAQIFFNRTEMVRSGFFMGIPLYIRPTMEPYSVVYVPLAGGRMQPYQRPRIDELTGTAGSVPSTLPYPPATVPPEGLVAQAAGAPSQTALEIPVQIPRPLVVPPESVPSEIEPGSPVGTTGYPPARPLHVQIGDKPEGTQSIFIEYEGQRWYPTGAPRILDRAALVRLPDFRGFEVWATSEGAAEILIPITYGSDMAVTYTRTRPESPFKR